MVEDYMSKFKKGDRVEMLDGLYKGEITTVDEDDSVRPWVVLESGHRTSSPQDNLQLIQENTMQYSQGDILIQNDRENKILAVCGELYFLSEDDHFEISSTFYTQEELNARSYKLKTLDSETIEINGKKYDRAAVTERLEELDEVA